MSSDFVLRVKPSAYYGVRASTEVAGDEEELACMQQIYDLECMRVQAKWDRERRPFLDLKKMASLRAAEQGFAIRDTLAANYLSKAKKARLRFRARQAARTKAREVKLEQTRKAEEEAQKAEAEARARAEEEAQKALELQEKVAAATLDKKAEAIAKADAMSQGKSDVVQDRVQASLTASCEEVDKAEERTIMAKEAKPKKGRRKPTSKVSREHFLLFCG
jgi:hypothetical protein